MILLVILHKMLSNLTQPHFSRRVSQIWIHQPCSPLWIRQMRSPFCKLCSTFVRNLLLFTQKSRQFSLYTRENVRIIWNLSH